MKNRFRMIPCFADDGSGAGGTNAEPTNTPNDGAVPNPEPATPPATFTQEQVDAILAQRLSRTKQGITQTEVEEMIKNALKPVDTKPATTEPPKVSAELQEASDALNEAKKIRTRAAFDVLAIKAGINTEALDDIATLIDLNAIELDGNGATSQTAIQEKIDELLKKYPAFKQQSGSYSGGSNPGGGADKPEAGSYGAALGKAVAESKGQVSQKMKDLLGF